MKKWQKIALGITATTATAYVVYPLIKNKIKKNTGDAALPSSVTDSDQDSYLEVNKNLSYQDKVKKLQQILEVNSDGVVGPITKGAIKKFLTLKTPLSAANIDSRIKKIFYLKEGSKAIHKAFLQTRAKGIATVKIWANSAPLPWAYMQAAYRNRFTGDLQDLKAYGANKGSNNTSSSWFPFFRLKF